MRYRASEQTVRDALGSLCLEEVPIIHDVRRNRRRVVGTQFRCIDGGIITVYTKTGAVLIQGKPGESSTCVLDVATKVEDSP